MEHKDIQFDIKRTDCVACGSEKIAFWRKKSLGGIVFLIDKCQECGTGFMNPRPTLKYLIDSIYATSGHGLVAPVSASTVLAAEKECPNCTRDARTLVSVAQTRLQTLQSRKALDVGSGYGFFSQAALEAGFSVTAVNPGRWENYVFYELTGLHPRQEAFEYAEFADIFDLVIMSQVLEHMHAPESALRKVRSLLTMRGVVAIAVPNFGSMLVRILREREKRFMGARASELLYGERTTGAAQ